MVREFHRILLSELPDYEADGWRPAVELVCGAVGADPWCGGALATITVVRDVTALVVLGDDRRPEGGSHE